jgi:hypothetical protein
VSLEKAQLAAAWCAYLRTHAERIYSCVTARQVKAARALSEKIKTKRVRREDGGYDWFAKRDVYLKGWTDLDTPAAVEAALEVLEDSGWVRKSSAETAGRSGTRYHVNPEVWS